MAQPPDPQVLAAIIHGFGQGRTRFNMALEQVSAIVPKLNEMGPALSQGRRVDRRRPGKTRQKPDSRYDRNISARRMMNRYSELKKLTGDKMDHWALIVHVPNGNWARAEFGPYTLWNKAHMTADEALTLLRHPSDSIN